MKERDTMKLLTRTIVLVIVLSMLAGPGWVPVKAAVTFDCANATIGVPIPECEALVALYESTNGDDWMNTKGYHDVWFSAQSVDLWFGVTVQSGHVFAIDLSNNNLTGHLTPMIGNLEALWTLNLDKNAISGSIPAELFNIWDIHEINLSNNSLSGPIPDTIGTGNAEDLSKFKVDNNNLSGAIPSTIGLAANLTELRLNSNDFYGPIPVELKNLTGLTLLDLSNNGLWVTDATLKTFLNTKSPGWDSTQSGQAIYPANGGFAGWGSGTAFPRFIFSQAWFDSPFKYTSTQYRVRIYKESDNSLIFSEEKIAYLNDGNPDNDMCPDYADWTKAGKCTFVATTSPVLVPGGYYYWTVETLKNDLTYAQFDFRHYFTLTSAPVAIQPQGVVAVANPEYKWQPIDGALSYYLWFGDSATHKVKDKIVGADQCINGVCSYQFITTTIAGNEYFWKVSGVINSEINDYSAFSSTFSFVRRDPPELVSPSGGLKITAKDPLLTWTKVEDATLYRLSIESGGTVIGEKEVDASVCGTTNCSSKAALALTNGSYTWKATAYTGTWGDPSNPASFEKLSPPTPKFPAVSATASNPKFIWTRVADQTKYQIQLFKNGTKIHEKTLDAPVCGSTTCSYTPSPALNLATGAYKWKVRSFNVVWGDYSAVKTFNKVAAPAPITPAGNITLTNPKFTWKRILGATRYYIVLQKSTGVLVKNMEVKTLSCTTTTCSYTPSPALNLAKGQYKWKVRAYNGYYGPYGATMSFTVK